MIKSFIILCGCTFTSLFLLSQKLICFFLRFIFIVKHLFPHYRKPKSFLEGAVIVYPDIGIFLRGEQTCKERNIIEY